MYVISVRRTWMCTTQTLCGLDSVEYSLDLYTDTSLQQRGRPDTIQVLLWCGCLRLGALMLINEAAKG